MEGKLYKSPNGEHYYLTVDGKIFAEIGGHPLKTINQSLSLKNCQAIVNGYDLDELADEIYFDGCDNTNRSAEIYRRIFKEGFLKAMELLGDKKFSEEDMKKAMNKIVTAAYSNKGDDIFDLFVEIHREKYMDEYIQSLQQTEWDVVIEMICPHPEDTYVCGMHYGCDEDGCYHHNQIPYLDKNGCLILKRK